MKPLFIILLTVTILAQSFVQVGMIVYYHINKAYISQTLCENRNNPNLHCNGHCYLSKQLKKADECEKKQAQNIVKHKDEVAPNHKRAVLACIFSANSSKKFSHYTFAIPFSDYRNDLVKPPTV